MLSSVLTVTHSLLHLLHNLGHCFEIKFLLWRSSADFHLYLTAISALLKPPIVQSQHFNLTYCLISSPVCCTKEPKRQKNVTVQILMDCTVYLLCSFTCYCQVILVQSQVFVEHQCRCVYTSVQKGLTSDKEMHRTYLLSIYYTIDTIGIIIICKHKNQRIEIYM